MGIADLLLKWVADFAIFLNLKNQTKPATFDNFENINRFAITWSNLRFKKVQDQLLLYMSLNNDVRRLLYLLLIMDSIYM